MTTALTRIHNHTYYFLDYDAESSVLHFGWKDAHEDMSEEDFREACSVYAGYAFEYNALLLLVDTRNFVFNVTEGYLTWQQNHHFPRFYKLGVKRKAYIMIPEHMAYVKDRPAEEGKLAIRYFTDPIAAEAWLAE